MALGPERRARQSNSYRNASLVLKPRIEQTTRGRWQRRDTHTQPQQALKTGQRWPRAVDRLVQLEGGREPWREQAHHRR